LPWDLYGRLAHHWPRRGNQTVSTLDLLSDGLTVLTGPDESRGGQAAATLNTRAPVTIHALNEPTARTIGILSGGAVLLRPDGRQLLDWSNASVSWSHPAQTSARTQEATRGS
jgi:putative polyketide hydroxylase